MALTLADFGLLVSALVAIRVMLAVLDFVYIYFIRKEKDLKKYGKWAVVTGASTGIGKGYATQLAARGLNVVLISRTKTALNTIAKEIEKKYRVKTMTLAIDLAADRATVEAAFGTSLDDLDIGILVNNAGCSYDHPDAFCDVDMDDIEGMISLNVHALTLVTKLILPGMVKRKRGAVVNISSASANAPMGLLSVYSGTKAYVDFFSRGLAQEYSHKGIDIQSVLPSLVSSRLSKLRASLTVPSADHYAAQAVKMIGYERQTAGYWAHQLQAIGLGLLPQRASEALVYQIHSAIRGKALRKKAKQAKAQ